MKKMIALTLLFLGFVAFSFLPEAANAQAVTTDYKNRIVNLVREGNDAQQGFIVSERKNKLYILTVRTKRVEDYPEDIVAVMSDGQEINGLWYTDDKALKKANLMMLIISKPKAYKLKKITYFTRQIPNQLVSLQAGNSFKLALFRVGISSDSTIALNPSSVFTPSANLVGAPIFLPERGLIGLVSSVNAIMVRAVRISLIRDAIRKDDDELFDPEPYDKQLDEVTAVKIGDITQKADSDKTFNKPTNPYPGSTMPTVSEVPDKVHRLRFGVGLGVNSVPVPASPAYDNQGKVGSYVSFTVNYRLFQRFVLHADPRWNKYKVIFAKDSKYANYALTHLDMESLEFPLGFDYHFSSKWNTFFLRVDGSVSNTLAGKYEYTFNGNTSTVSLRNDQKTWQKAAIFGLGMKSKHIRLLVSYYYAFDSYISDNELTNTVPRVTPFKQQQTNLRCISLELGFYF